MNGVDDLVRFLGFVFFLLAMISLIGAMLSRITAHMAEKVWKMENKDAETETDIPPHSSDE